MLFISAVAMGLCVQQKLQFCWGCDDNLNTNQNFGTQKQGRVFSQGGLTQEPISCNAVQTHKHQFSPITVYSQ